MTNAQEWLNENVPNINKRTQITHLTIHRQTGNKTNQNNHRVFYNTTLEGELDLNEFVNLQQLCIQGIGNADNQKQKLTNLKINKCVKLNNLVINYTILAKLDIEKNPNLKVLNCNFNQLTEIIFGDNTILQILYFANNQLKTLDLSKIPNLIDLNAVNNQLTSLNLSKNIKLSNIQKDGKTDFYAIFFNDNEEKNKTLVKERDQSQNQLTSIISIIKSNNNFANNNLKETVKNIEKENSTRQWETKKQELEKLIIKTKKEVKEENHEWLETLLEAHLETLKGTNIDFIKKQLEKAQRILNKEITNEELQNILTKQQEVKELEQKLTDLETHIEVLTS